MGKQSMDEVEALARNGYPLRSIAKKTGLTYSAVRGRLNRVGVKARPERLIVGLPEIYRRVEDMEAEDAVDYLLGVVEALLGRERPDAHAIDAWADFKIVERRLVIALYDAKGAILSRERLMSALYYDRAIDETPAQKIIDVFVCRARKRLPDAVTIETVYGRGWRLHVPEQMRGAIG